ncbi:MAG: hypothetical protein K6F44_01040 [Lachnospiraceae bacterium]|nr:hypothetical protein [Lachnospiraceae bacterium]
MRYDRRITQFFIVIETVIYITFILLDLTGNAPFFSDLLKYSGILLVVGFAIYRCVKNCDKDLIIVTSALFFTAVADLFLLFFSDNILMLIPGLISFSVTQTLYSVHTSTRKCRSVRILIPCLTMITSVCLSCLVGSFLCYDFSVATLVTLVFYYSITFAANTARSWMIYLRTSLCSDLFFAVGMTLFVLCDINILIRHLNSFFSGTIPGGMVSAAVFLSWVFYLPAQVFIGMYGTFRDHAGSYTFA